MVKLHDEFYGVHPATRDAFLKVTALVDDETVVVERANGMRQTMPVSTLLTELWWARA